MATLTLTDNSFEDTVANNGIVVVDFWATWCGPCKAFAPIYDKVSEKFPEIVFGKVDTDAEQQLASTFHIRSIPTLMIFRDKIIVFSQPGMLPEKSFVEVLEKVVALDMVQVHKDIAKQSKKT